MSVCVCVYSYNINNNHRQYQSKTRRRNKFIFPMGSVSIIKKTIQYIYHNLRMIINYYGDNAFS